MMPPVAAPMDAAAAVVRSDATPWSCELKRMTPAPTPPAVAPSRPPPNAHMPQRRCSAQPVATIANASVHTTPFKMPFLVIVFSLLFASRPENGRCEHVKLTIHVGAREVAATKCFTTERRDLSP